jgi:23S rRNA (cytidine1920-2'-O)/16S rRNA (cytidine1409-2'-O)-methyltransferase
VVLVRGAVADKAARLVAESDPVVVEAGDARFVSRGGRKLDSALQHWSVAVTGLRCLDAGASTGGFTDCLLQRGAAAVVAVDVGHGLAHPRVRADSRVVLLERTNVRTLDLDSVGGEPFDVLVADLSFISLTAVVDVLAGELAKPGAELVFLVKPQFEAGREVASRGRGVVTDPLERLRALERVASALCSAGASIIGAMPSPLLGPSGNAEFFVRAKAHGAGSLEDSRQGSDLDPSELRMLDAAVSEAPDRALAARETDEIRGAGTAAVGTPQTPATTGRETAPAPEGEGAASEDPGDESREVRARKFGIEQSW